MTRVTRFVALAALVLLVLGFRPLPAMADGGDGCLPVQTRCPVPCVVTPAPCPPPKVKGVEAVAQVGMTPRTLAPTGADRGLMVLGTFGLLLVAAGCATVSAAPSARRRPSG